MTLNKSGAKRWGFELAALKDSDGNQAGSFTLINIVSAQIQTFNGISYLSHTNRGSRAGFDGPTIWSFVWRSPAENVGRVTFYASGNAAENGATTADDFIYQTSQRTKKDGIYDLTLNIYEYPRTNEKAVYLRIVDMTNGREVARDKKDLIGGSSAWMFPEVLVKGHSYNVDFWVDFNENGYYNYPPTDHAWQIVISNASADYIRNFSLTNDYSNIRWKYAVMLNFSGMSSHIDRHLGIRLVDNSSINEIIRDTMTISEADFSVTLPGIDSSNNYTIDFFVDVNGNGSYDAPPADYAWRTFLTPSFHGDTTLSFAHTMDFIDIEWDVVASVAAADETGMVKNYRLAQNFPNPFNPATTIEFSIPANENVQLIVYNILGQKVKTLIDRAFPSGTYSILWDGTNEAGTQVAGGLYIYRLTAGKTAVTRKMIYMK